MISIEKDNASVQSVCFSIDHYYVLVCVGLEGLVYRVKVCACVCVRACVYMRACMCVCVHAVGYNGHRTQDGKLDTTITGHTGLLTCAVFSPWQHDIIVTAAEDRTYMVHL